MNTDTYTVEPISGEARKLYNELMLEHSANIITGQKNIEAELWDIAKLFPETYDTIDHITDGLFQYEAALIEIGKGNIPADNVYYQALVVRLAYNAITNIDGFAWIVANSRFTEQDIQTMIDLAASQVVWHKNFEIDERLTMEGEQAGYLQYVYCSCKLHNCKVLSN